MINHRFFRPGPAQRAAAEIRNTINGVAADVREMSGAIQELRADAKAPMPPAQPEHVPGTESNSDAPVQSQEIPRPALTDSPPPAGVRERPPPLTLPPVPDVRPQLEAFVNAAVRNQQTAIALLHDIRRLLDAQAMELAQLRQQVHLQQNVTSNLRRY